MPRDLFAAPSPDDLRSFAVEEAQRQGVDPGHILPLFRQESRFNAAARGPVTRTGERALGPAQLMPGTAAKLGVNPEDPFDNIRGGITYYKQQLDRFKDPAIARAAYNAGPGVVEKYGGVPPFAETQNYVAKTQPARDLFAEMGAQPIDRSRPILENKDGTFSTERTITVEMDGRHYVIPTIVGGRDVGPDQAVQMFRSGQNPAVGAFGNAAEAETYAQQRSAEIGRVRGPDRQPEKVSFEAPFRQQLRQGIMETYRGGKQLALKAGEALGIVDPKTAQQYSRQVSEEQQLYAAHNPNFQAGRLLGNIAAIPVPMPAAASATIPRLMAQGAATAALQPVVGPDEQFWRGKAVQAGTGAVLAPVVSKAAQGVMNTIGKAAGAMRGRPVSPEAAELTALSRQHGVPLTYSDIVESQTARRAEDVLEYTPVLGTAGSRLAQRKAAEEAANTASDKLRNEMLDMRWNGLAQVDKAAAAGSKAAQLVRAQVDAAGEDWNRIIQASGNLNLFRKKMISDRYFGETARQAQGLGEVPMSQTNSAITSALGKIEKDVLPDTELGSVLARVQDRLNDPSVDTTFTGINRLRSDLGDMISDFYKGKDALTGSKGVELLSRVQKAVEQDMESFAGQSGNQKLLESWKRSNSFYAQNVAPYKDSALGRALKDAPPDEIFSKYIQSGAGKADRAREFFNALDPRGQSAVRYGLVTRALDDAFDAASGKFDAGKLATNLERMSDARGVVFKGAGKQELDGFTKLMRHAERSARASIPVMSAQQSLGVVASAVGGFLHMPLTVAAGGMAGATRLLFTTDAGKRFLLSANMLKPGSNAMADLVARMNAELTKGAAAAAGGEQGQPGRILP